jgi:hypothetical protein
VGLFSLGATAAPSIGSTIARAVLLPRLLSAQIHAPFAGHLVTRRLLDGDVVAVMLLLHGRACHQRAEEADSPVPMGVPLDPKGAGDSHPYNILI